MKTKLLYVVASNNDDVYVEQAHISIFSAKYYMPDCHVTLLVDDTTDKNMDENRRKILKNVDEYIVITLPEKKSAHVRSRLLKCGAREYVKGDFLYIDADTIIAKPLYEIDMVTASVAATRDSHCEFSQNPYRKMDVEFGNTLGFPLENESTFFNGGVLYAKDDEIAHRFYKMWLEEWKIGKDKGVKMDQPALAKTNYQMGHVVKQIDDTWNCEFLHGMRYMKDAKIVHYLTTNIKRDDVEPYILKSAAAYDLLKEDLDNVTDDFYVGVIKDPFTGINSLTTITAGKETLFRRTWLYGRLFEWFVNGKKFERFQSILFFVSNIKNKLLFRR